MLFLNYSVAFTIMVAVVNFELFYFVLRNSYKEKSITFILFNFLEYKIQIELSNILHHSNLDSIYKRTKINLGHQNSRIVSKKKI
jgi:hypothetical protein